MRALVTGASGFVGRHLVEHLRAMGDEVVATDRSDGGPDLLDAKALDLVVAEAQPDAIFHLAGQADVGASWHDDVGTLKANAEGVLNLLASARQHDVQRVLTVSSADVYGRVDPGELPIHESAPLRPVSPYGASKAAADLLALQAHLGHGQNVIRVRAFNHLGPGQDTRFVCSALAARIAANELDGTDDVVVGDLTARRDFTDVRDVVRAYRLLVEHAPAGDAFNVCTGRSVAIGDVAQRLMEVSGRPMTLVPDPTLMRPVDIADL